MADAEKATGDLEASAAHFREAIAGFRAADDPIGVADGLAGLAGVLARQERFEDAARLLAAAAAHMPADAGALTETAQFREDVGVTRHGLGGDRFAAAWDAGQALSLDAAIAMTEIVGQT